MITRRERNSGSRIPSGYSMSCHARLKKIRPINGGTPLCRWYHERELAGNSSKRNFERSISAKDSLTRRGKSSWS
ncbi:hypothetical protein EPI10_015457 [Gossypium australe]|uniref:Uncharacterized protein n=1 Tax=Gossypium australe TaxID=47621 RepID=A0A5B6VL08_9ROSI|nr:hypothetical protein EPI10_015457 [Gossypium australe]